VDVGNTREIVNTHTCYKTFIRLKNKFNYKVGLDAEQQLQPLE
jgi:hypothetical protein